jgi:hypothetical protein
MPRTHTKVVGVTQIVVWERIQQMEVGRLNVYCSDVEHGVEYANFR